MPIGNPQTINMGQTVYIGLALCSNNSSTLATATYDNVSVNSAATPAPVISSISATSASVGGQIVISGTGFGAAQGNSIVTLNGAPVTINSWSNTSLTITIPAGATSGPMSVLVAPSMNASNPVTFDVSAQPLPTPWLDQDLGLVGTSGSATFANGVFTVKGAGSQIWGSADSFHFTYQSLSGDGTIVARVVSISPSSATPGIMIRDSLNLNAMSAFGAYFASNAYLNYRTTTGGSTSQSSAAAGPLPYWLKLSRSGSTVSAFTSADGANWMPIGNPQTINMGQTVYIGLALCSNNPSTLATATYDNVSVSTP
jgi:regulation of enolase protein 1 (concanavalin A-like superfamily)